MGALLTSANKKFGQFLKKKVCQSFLMAWF